MRERETMIHKQVNLTLMTSMTVIKRRREERFTPLLLNAGNDEIQGLSMQKEERSDDGNKI